jgi:alpha-galactosidase
MMRPSDLRLAFSVRRAAYGGIAVLFAVACSEDAPPRGIENVAAPSEPAPAEGGPAPNEGALASTPPMGFNNWNAFGCDVNEALIKETADFFVSSGLKDAGYQYVNIDDCWSMMERGADGQLVPDPVKFPSGIAGVADYVHGLGLKLGIYGDAGTRTCAGYPGSLGTEALDAQTWAAWGVDYVKYDNCYNQSDGTREDFVRRYTAMHDALLATGRPIVYSICEWGQSQPWEWAPAMGIGHLWRTTGDITDNWSSIRDIITFNAPLAEYAGPGHWNDPDMLEVGNGALTTIEKRTHFSMWAMMAAPLIIGTDLRIATEETLSILENREIIALDQDPLGTQGAIVSNEAGLMVLGKPLASGEHAIALYNSTDAQALVSVPATSVGLQAADAYFLHDIWAGTDTEARGLIAAGVPAHGTAVLRVRPLQASDVVPPSLAVEGSLGTLIPGVPDVTLLKTRVTNHGVGSAGQVNVAVQAPEGWVIAALTGASGETLATDGGIETTWSVAVPASVDAGRYPITVSVAYTWGAAAQSATTSTEVVGAVAVAPPAGMTPLSTLLPVSSANGLGPVELDTSNGNDIEGDGNLISIGGKVYTRGIGTNSPSSVVFYLGGQCSQLTVDVGIDDEVVAADAQAAFQIFADDVLVAESAALGANDAAVTLTADVTGATLLRLVTDPAGAPANDHADWAAPQIVCGGSNAPTRVEQTLFSFEGGTDEFTIANAETGGALAASAPFATNGSTGLEVTSPVDGNWFGRRFAAPMDLSGFSTLRYDVSTDALGTPGEFALEVGPDAAWCQGGLWTWTNANASKTIERRFEEIECPEGVTLDRTQVLGLWVFLKDGTFQIDNVRAE